MDLYLYPTDLRWFEFLRSRNSVDEVNFWQPGGSRAFSRLRVGELFLFRLKHPVNMIGGGGFFLHASVYPLDAAWDAFGEKNGTPDLAHLTQLIAGYKHVTPWQALSGDSPIGCIILAEPFFWPEEKWLPVPEDFHPNLVQGKRYDVATPSGRALFEAVMDRLNAPMLTGTLQSGAHPVHEVPELAWQQRLVRQRVGQGGFRVLITDLYDRRCAISGERTLPVLEAAHIQPVTRGGTHQPTNGLLLRSDIHKLFDLGYVTIKPTGEFRVSPKLREAWSNGRIYYALDHTALRRPANEEYGPDRELLEWHNDTVFRG